MAILIEDVFLNFIVLYGQNNGLKTLKHQRKRKKFKCGYYTISEQNAKHYNFGRETISYHPGKILQLLLEIDRNIVREIERKRLASLKNT